MKTNFKEIFNRAKNIIIQPKNEWNVVAAENKPHAEVLLGYLIWLTIIPVVCALIGWSSYFGLAVKMAIQQAVTIIAGAYFTALIFNELATKYGAVKNFNKAFELVAYCYTAICLSGLLLLIPGLKYLSFIFSLYGLYLMYIGLKPMMSVPDEKVNNYFIVSLLVMIGVSLILSIIVSAVIIW
ncbi:MAG: Yip1 family protein [Bacteroidales bacterium]|nr:Yip1 family protein [Bacteroidales bacterium]MDD3990052.1 Yip1 family protein [Bacteroidales bacterium]MDD4638323.1 Yip1 family protein [Bacteroidales bacterium]